MRLRLILIVMCVLTFAGCASLPERNLDESKVTDDLKNKLNRISEKFEAAKKENLNLKKELTLYRKSLQIDTKRFIDALDIFEKELAEDILKQEAWVNISDRGLVIAISAEELFVSGSDVLSEDGKVFLDKISGIMNKIFDTNYIYVEGHTDNQSLAVFEWKSDWDFSFVRALNVVQYFTEKIGINPLRLSASGFGQYRPRAENETKEGRRLNRRIEIVVSSQKLKRLK